MSRLGQTEPEPQDHGAQAPRQGVEQLSNRQLSRALVCVPIVEPHSLLAPLLIEVVQ